MLGKSFTSVYLYFHFLVYHDFNPYCISIKKIKLQNKGSVTQKTKLYKTSNNMVEKGARRESRRLHQIVFTFIYLVFLLHGS